MNSYAPPKRKTSPYSELVTRLVRAQWHARQEGALELAHPGAPTCRRWSLETFPFARQPGVNRKQIRALPSWSHRQRREHRVGGEDRRRQNGTLLCLLLKALENGYRCQFIRAQDLFDEMYASLADRSTRQLLKRLARLDVTSDRRVGYLTLNRSRATSSQTDGRTVSLPLHNHYTNLVL